MKRRVGNMLIGSIEPDPYQPRKRFRTEALAELAASIRAHGLLQPVVVRRAGTGYRLVAGERRWRSAKLAGLARIPCLVSEIPPARAFPAQLVENLMRQDLTPLDEAHAYGQLQAAGMSPAEIAELCAGGNESRIRYKLDLLKLAPVTMAALEAGVLSETQAHVLTRLSPQGQTRAFQLLRARGLHNFQRVVTAIQEQERQAPMFQVDAARQGADERKARLLETVPQRLLAEAKRRAAKRGPGRPRKRP